MKNKIAKIFIGLVFLMGILNASAQSKWDEIEKNIKKKGGEEAAVEYANRVLPQLKKTVEKKATILAAQIDKIAQLNLIAEKANSQIASNNELIEKYKGQIRKEQLADVKAGRIKNAGNIASHRGEIEKLEKNSLNQKKVLKTRKKYKSLLKKSKDKLKKEVSYLRKSINFIKKASKIVEYDEAAAATFGVTGEMWSWYEGHSSFKNVVLRAVKEGGKAVVSIGAGALAGTATAAISLNPLATGGAAVLSAVTAEEFYNATIGKSFDRLMDREHDAINKYAADPEKLEKMREENKRKAYEEIKNISKEIAKNQEGYNEELRKYIEERKRLREEFEEKMRIDEENLLKLEREETPLVAQKPSKKRIKPGESVTITVETIGGLLPIQYSGELSYLIENGYDRYLIAYKWTAEKDIKPGFYEFTVRAKSASGKVGKSTITIEVIDTKPAPKVNPIKKIENNKNLNIKEIPGANIREMIYKVNGIYYGICQTPANIKTQKFEIQIGVNPQNIEGKLGIAHLNQFAGSKTIQLSEETVEKMRKKMPGLPEERIPKTGKVYFHAWGRFMDFDPVSGRIWGKLDGESSVYENYQAKADIKGAFEAKLQNGVITGTISFTMGPNDYSFPFSAKQ